MSSRQLNLSTLLHFFSSTGFNGRLPFPVCPAGEPIAAEALLDERRLPLAAFSALAATLLPLDFPSGTLRDAAERRLPFHSLLLQVLKLEGFLLTWVLFWAILSVCVPCVVIAHICCPDKKRQRLEDHGSNSSVDRIGRGGGGGGRLLACLLHGLLLVLMSSILLLLGSNEQLSKSLTRSPETATMLVEDLQRFIRNTEMQIGFVTTTSMEYAADAIEKDLDDSLQISERVRRIAQHCVQAGKTATLLQQKLDELAPLIVSVHQQCSQRDRPLCESILVAGLDVTFRTDEISADMKLKYLGGLSADMSFAASLGDAEMRYGEIPRRVASETESQRGEIRRELQKHRTSIHKSLRSLEALSRSSQSAVRTGGGKLVPFLEEIASGDVWRYLGVLVASIIIFLIWALLMCGAPCGCGSGTTKSRTFLALGLIVASISTLYLFTLATGTLILGAHGQKIICNAFDDEPYYKTFTDLMDDGGLIYPNGGYFKHILEHNETLAVADILRKSQRNSPSYTTFKLRHKLNLNDIINCQPILEELDNFHVRSNKIDIFTSPLDQRLTDLIVAANANLTQYRVKLSRSITSKDLSTFLDQTYATAKQIGDGRTASRFEKVILRLRDIIGNEYGELMDRRDGLLYEVTALEVMLVPLLKNVEFAMGRLKLMQSGMELEGDTLLMKISEAYTNQMKAYLNQFGEYVYDEITFKVARTQPLWNIFWVTRESICCGVMDSLNALAFSCYMALLVILLLVPVTRRIMKRYRELEENQTSPIIRRRGSDNIIHRTGSSNWGTPPTPGTPEPATRDASQEIVWASPRRLSPGPRIPPPPRPPSDSRPSRSPVRTISRSPFSRYDSLRLVEETAWRSSTSITPPRNWI